AEFGGVAGGVVEDAEGAHRLAARSGDRVAGVEADVGVAEDEGVVGEAIVEAGIADNRRLRFEDRVAAEAGVASALLTAEAERGLEPDPVLVEQVDLGGLGLEEALGEPGEPVEALLAFAVEDVERVQRRQAARLFWVVGRGWHLGLT